MYLRMYFLCFATIRKQACSMAFLMVIGANILDGDYFIEGLSHYLIYLGK